MNELGFMLKLSNWVSTSILIICSNLLWFCWVSAKTTDIDILVKFLILIQSIAKTVLIFYWDSFETWSNFKPDKAIGTIFYFDKLKLRYSCDNCWESTDTLIETLEMNCDVIKISLYKSKVTSVRWQSAVKLKNPIKP